MCGPLCEIQAKVSKSNYEIASIKVWFLPLISLSFKSLTWPYSVNINDIKVTFSQNVFYHMKNVFFFVETANHKKMTSWSFTYCGVHVCYKRATPVKGKLYYKGFCSTRRVMASKDECAATWTRWQGSMSFQWKRQNSRLSQKPLHL